MLDGLGWQLVTVVSGEHVGTNRERQAVQECDSHLMILNIGVIVWLLMQEFTHLKCKIHILTVWGLKIHLSDTATGSLFVSLGAMALLFNLSAPEFYI